MNYAVIRQANGAFNVEYEGENLNSLKYNFDHYCSLLWNDTGAVDAIVKLVDSNLDVVDGFTQIIKHEAKA